LWNVPKKHQFCPKFNGKVPKKGVDWQGWGLRSRLDNASSLIGLIYGGHEMVQQHLTLWNVPKQHSFALELMAKR
jgi:hypothetical protein